MTLLARDDVGPVEADRGELARLLLPTVLRVAANMMKEETVSDEALLVSSDTVERLVTV